MKGYLLYLTFGVYIINVSGATRGYIISMNENTINKEDLFNRCVAFRAMDKQGRQDLSAFAHVKRYAAGEVIYTMGEPGHSMMAIVEGVVRVELTTPTGRDVILGELRAGDVFGEIALLDGGDRSATVRAMTNCKLLVLERRALLAAIRRTPDFAIRLIEILCQRVRRSDDRMVEISFMDLPTRLARLLLRLSIATPARPETASTRISLSQTDLAKMIGNTRENVNRCLRKWQEAQLVELKEGWLVVKDRPSLEKLADGN